MEALHSVTSVLAVIRLSQNHKSRCTALLHETVLNPLTGFLDSKYKQILIKGYVCSTAYI